MVFQHRTRRGAVAKNFCYFRGGKRSRVQGGKGLPPTLENLVS
jgi:hypothetical protein